MALEDVDDDGTDVSRLGNFKRVILQDDDTKYLRTKKKGKEMDVLINYQKWFFVRTNLR